MRVKKYLQQIFHFSSCCVEIIILFMSIVCGSLFFKVGFSGVFYKEFFYKKSPEIIATNDTVEEDGYLLSTGGDPYIIIKVKPGMRVLLNLDFIYGASIGGQVFYSNEDSSFREEDSFAYAYKNGENIIEVNNETASILRIDYTNYAGVKLVIKDAAVESDFRFYFERLDYLFIIVVAIILSGLFNYFRETYLCEHDCDKVFGIIVFFAVGIIYSHFIFGDAFFIYRDMGSDTYDQYYPYLVNVSESIRNGEFSLWNWSYGLGTALVKMQTWTFDPFSAVVVFLGVIFSSAIIHRALVWMQITKIVIVFFISKKFLGYYVSDSFSKNLGGCIATFNGFLILWGQHYHFGTAYVLLWLYLLSLESFISRRKMSDSMLLTILTAITLVFSFYFGYMILLFSGVYFILRASRFESGWKLVKTIAKCALHVIIGGMISASIFIPACYRLISTSNRLARGQHSKLENLVIFFRRSFDFDFFFTRMSRMLSNNFSRETIHWADYESPMFFCNIFIFFFIVQWIILGVRKNKQNRNGTVRFILISLLVTLLITNAMMAYIMTGFVAAVYRYTFVVAPLLCICVSEVWQDVVKKNNISVIGLCISGIFSIITLVYSYVNAAIEIRPYVIMVSFFLVAGFVCLLLDQRKGSSYHNIGAFLFCIILISTTIIDDYISTNDRVYLREEGYTLEWRKGELVGSTVESLEYLRGLDDSFYRVGKDYAIWQKWSDSFFFRYSSPEWYNSVANKHVISFYKHIYPGASNGFVSVFQLEDDLDKIANDLMGTKYVLSKFGINDNSWELISRNKDILIYRNRGVESAAKWYTSTIRESEFIKKSNAEKVELLKKAAVTDTGIEILDNSDAEIGKFRLESQSKLLGFVNCSGKGLLVIPVPYQEGWSVYDNEKKVSSIRCNLGFTGVVLEKGQHKITMEYEMPLGKEGLLLSFVGLVLFLATTIVEKKLQNGGTGDCKNDL